MTPKSLQSYLYHADRITHLVSIRNYKSDKIHYKNNCPSFVDHFNKGHHEVKTEHYVTNSQYFTGTNSGCFGCLTRIDTSPIVTTSRVSSVQNTTSKH